MIHTGLKSEEQKRENLLSEKESKSLVIQSWVFFYVSSSTYSPDLNVLPGALKSCPEFVRKMPGQISSIAGV